MALIEIGAAWTRHGNAGEFLSVKIGDKSALMFRNTKKPEGSKQPDWRLMSDDETLVATFGKQEEAQPQHAPQAVEAARKAFDAEESGDVPF